jgi:hypothetical protein
MLPITVEIPAGTTIRIIPSEGAAMTKTAAYMEKTAGHDQVTLNRGQVIKLFESHDDGGREVRSDLVVLRGV